MTLTKTKYQPNLILGDIKNKIPPSDEEFVCKRIKIKEIEGVIESIDNISVVIVTSNGKMVFPIKEVVDEIVLVKNNEDS